MGGREEKVRGGEVRGWGWGGTDLRDLGDAVVGCHEVFAEGEGLDV